jgi:multidrug resistance efflux pump
MNRGTWLALGLALIVLGGPAATWIYLHRAKPTVAPAVVEQQPPNAGEITLTGNVTPRDAVPVAAPLDGILEVLEVPLGSEVLMGQIIGRMANQRLIEVNNSAEEALNAAQERVGNLEAQLTTAKLEAARAAAEATATEGELDRAKANADRQEALFKEGATSRNAYELSKKQLATAQSDYAILRESAKSSEERAKTLTADLEATKNSIEDRTKTLEESAASLRTGEVLSPIDGVLIASKVQPGDDVPPKTTDLFHVAPSALKLAVALEPDPATAAMLRDGLEAQVTLGSMPDTPFPAKVMKRTDGSWQVHFDATEPVWRPGELASVRIRLP